MAQLFNALQRVGTVPLSTGAAESARLPAAMHAKVPTPLPGRSAQASLHCIVPRGRLLPSALIRHEIEADLRLVRRERRRRGRRIRRRSATGRRRVRAGLRAAAGCAAPRRRRRLRLVVGGPLHVAALVKLVLELFLARLERRHELVDNTLQRSVLAQLLQWVVSQRRAAHRARLARVEVLVDARAADYAPRPASHTPGRLRKLPGRESERAKRASPRARTGMHALGNGGRIDEVARAEAAPNVRAHRRQLERDLSWSRSVGRPSNSKGQLAVGLHRVVLSAWRTSRPSRIGAMYLSSSLSSLLLPAPPSPSSSDRGCSPSPSPAASSTPSAPASRAPSVSSGTRPVGDAGAAGASFKGALSVGAAWPTRASASIVPCTARCRSVRSVSNNGNGLWAYAMEWPRCQASQPALFGATVSCDTGPARYADFAVSFGYSSCIHSGHSLNYPQKLGKKYKGMFKTLSYSR